MWVAGKTIVHNVKIRNTALQARDQELFGDRNLFFLWEKALLKNDEHAHAYRNAHVGNIKNVAEKDGVIAANEWNPFGHIAFPKGKIQHIHHATVKEPFITEQYTVKYRIDDVAKCASKN